jgi:demethylspheroidene O-methyltransferase
MVTGRIDGPAAKRSRDSAATRRAAAASSHSSWVDRLYAARDRLLANPAFQRWAAAFPLTRPIANHHASALFDLCAGFVYAQVLAACIQLKLFDALSERPRTPDRLAAECAMPVEAMRRLLAAAVALGLLAERSGGRYGLGMLGAALRGNPGIAAMVEHHAMLYDDLRDPVALLRGGGATKLADYWPYAKTGDAGAVDAASVAGYTTLMSASQGVIAEDILAAYNFGRHKRLLDIGGGDGAFLIAAAPHAPELRLTLFDLPPVAERAAKRFAARGIGERAAALGGNFLQDPLPSGADLITLIRILLDHDDDAALEILRAARRAIAPDGVLLVAEPISGLAGSRAVTDAYFGLYLFAMGNGRPRGLPQFKALLEEAGFCRVRALPTRRPLLTNLVTASPQNA